MPRRVEIAGAGIAGLTAAAALAQRGWQVRVHERAANLRGGGFGITLFGNGLRVLASLGALDDAVRGGVPIAGLENFSADGRLLARQTVPRPGAAVRIARRRLIEALATQAMQAGASLHFGAAAAAADPAGALMLRDGTRLPADLVLVADGAASAVRDSLGLQAQVRTLAEGATRVLVPRAPDDFPQDGAGFVQEWWSGRRRLLFSAVSDAEVYVTLVCHTADAEARRVPLDPSAWGSSFPRMRHVLERVARDADWPTTHWEQFRVLRLSAWSRGRAAVLGDAAHAMPPNLGQGGGCALMNALGLAVALDRHPDVPEALAEWERTERPLTQHTQRWSRLFSALVPWPRPLRDAALAAAGHVPFVRASLQRTANHVPTGTDPAWRPAA
jgi:2-polyprenyl-6-methoxyphenol hydroxylase-like FAD-dependent oxidoreductase